MPKHMNQSPYLSEAYGVADAAENDWQLLSAADERFQIPVVFRREGNIYDASSPYGYPGMAIDENLSPTEVNEAWNTVWCDLRESGAISLFVRFSPTRLDMAARASGLNGLRVRHASNTVAVDTVDLDATMAGISSSARRQIRKAERHGLTASTSVPSTFDTGDGAAFVRLYTSTMRRIGAREEHLRSNRYWERLSTLGDALRLIVVRDAAGAVVSAATALVDGEVLQYHLAGSDPVRGQPLGANNLLIWQMFALANELRLTSAHLGGGLRAGDSLMRFKRTFGGRRLPYLIGTALLDEAAYKAATTRHAIRLGVPIADLINTDYFPTYRATPPVDRA